LPQFHHYERLFSLEDSWKEKAETPFVSKLSRNAKITKWGILVLERNSDKEGVTRETY
jgi:hypothetical protein